MLRRVALVRADVSEELCASIIRVTRIDELETTLAVTSSRSTLRSRRFLQEPRGVTSLKTAFFIVTAVKTSNLKKLIVIRTQYLLRFSSNREFVLNVIVLLTSQNVRVDLNVFKHYSKIDTPGGSDNRWLRPKHPLLNVLSPPVFLRSMSSSMSLALSLTYMRFLTSQYHFAYRSLAIAAFLL
jgi:hypothetical protein